MKIKKTEDIKNYIRLEVIVNHTRYNRDEIRWKYNWIKGDKMIVLDEESDEILSFEIARREGKRTLTESFVLENVRVGLCQTFVSAYLFRGNTLLEAASFDSQPTWQHF